MKITDQLKHIKALHLLGPYLLPFILLTAVIPISAQLPIILNGTIRDVDSDKDLVGSTVELLNGNNDSVLVKKTVRATVMRDGKVIAEYADFSVILPEDSISTYILVLSMTGYEQKRISFSKDSINSIMKPFSNGSSFVANLGVFYLKKVEVLPK